MQVGGHEWTHFGRSVPSLCCAGQRAACPLPRSAEAPIKVLLYTYLLRLGELYLGLGREGIGANP